MKWIYILLVAAVGGILIFLFFRKRTVSVTQVPPDTYLLPVPVSPVVDNSGILGDAIKTGVGALLTSSAGLAAGAGIFAAGGSAVAPIASLVASSAPLAALAPSAAPAAVLVPSGAGLGSLGIGATLGAVGLGLFALYEIGNITGAFDKDMTGRDQYGNFIQDHAVDYLGDLQLNEANQVRGGDRS
jgi:hypothetical protein